MKIVLFDLATVEYPGGCEKYTASLANNFSEKDDVTAVGSKEYVTFMGYVFRVVTGRKIEKINYVKRDIGKANKLDLKFTNLIPGTSGFRKIKVLLNSAELIYSKNDFQELLFLYCFLGKENYSKKVVIGVHTAIFVPSEVKGVWKKIHDIQYYSLFYRKFLRSAYKIHVLNSDYIELISKQYDIPKEKIVLVPIPIDWKTYLSNGNNKKFNILWLGRLTQQKGLDRLEELISVLSKQKNFKDMEVIIGGEGELESIVNRLVSKYDNVKFLGYINNVADLYKQADLVIVTSYFETFGYNVLEPQSFGIPVISFNIAGPKDIIIPNKTGFLVDDVKEFADKIIWLNKLKLFNKVDFEKMRGNIYKNSNRKYSKDYLLKRLEKLLKENSHSVVKK